MGEIVNLDVTTLEESVSVTTTDGGTVEVAVQAEKGDTGPAGPAGPNTVTSATTTNLTGLLKGNGSNVTTAQAWTDYTPAIPRALAIYESVDSDYDGIYVLNTTTGKWVGNNLSYIQDSETAGLLELRTSDDILVASGSKSETFANLATWDDIFGVDFCIVGNADIVTSHALKAASKNTALPVDTLTANVSVNIADNGVDPVVSMTINGFSVGATTLGDGNIYLSKGLDAGSFIQTTNVTSVRTFELPDASGTIALTTSNVATATALQNSRNIFGIAFNGTANVSGDATNAGHFASIPTGGQAGHFITLNGTAPTVIAGRSAWWSDSSGNPSFRNGTGAAVTLVRSSDLGTGVATALAVAANGSGGFVTDTGTVTLTNKTLTAPTIDRITLDGNISAAAWTTNGIRVRGNSVTLTDTTSTGTVAAAYTNAFGGNTIAASNATTYTHYTTGYFREPTAGSNVTITNRWALGADSLRIGTSNHVTISSSGILSATNAVFVTPALGTPQSGTLTNCTGLPISTGVSGLASGIATFLQTPSSANLAAAVTDETGSGSLVFANSPTITTPTIAQINVASSLLILGAGAAGLFGLRSNSATGYSSLELLNSGGTQMGGFGYANVSAGAYADQVYFYSAGKALILASAAGSRHVFLSTTGDVSIGSGAAANTRAVLDLTSTTKGFLPPRMTTTQRDAITSVPAGLMIYNTTTNKLNFYNGSAWEAVTSA